MSTTQNTETAPHGYGPGHGRQAPEVVAVPRAMLDSIRQYADLYSHQGDKGWEACGLVGGTWDGTVVRCLQLAVCANTATDPHHYFRLAPWDQWHVGEAWVAQGLQVVGVWHSHPSSGTRPSATDSLAIPEGLVSIIHSVPHDECAAYFKDNQLPWKVVG